MTGLSCDWFLFLLPLVLCYVGCTTACSLYQRIYIGFFLGRKLHILIEIKQNAIFLSIF